MTRTKRPLLAGLLFCLVMALLPATAHAQLGALKKKAARAVAGAAGVEESQPDAKMESQSARRGPYNDYVLEMTPAVLDRMEKALAAESAERAEVAKVLATFAKPDERMICEQRVAGTPEVQKLLEEYMAALEKANGDSKAVIAAAEKMEAGMKAVVDRECGEALAAERERELHKRPLVVGAEAGGFTEYQYAVLRERIAPFCRAGDALETSADGASLPVAGTKHRLVYSNIEIEALTPRCASFTKVLADG